MNLWEISAEIWKVFFLMNDDLHGKETAYSVAILFLPLSSWAFNIPFSWLLYLNISLRVKIQLQYGFLASYLIFFIPEEMLLWFSGKKRQGSLADSP